MESPFGYRGIFFLRKSPEQKLLDGLKYETAAENAPNLTDRCRGDRDILRLQFDEKERR